MTLEGRHGHLRETRIEARRRNNCCPSRACQLRTSLRSICNIFSDAVLVWNLRDVVGLELFGEVALLRSLAVASSRRGTGVGSGLVAHAERHARDQGVQSLFLLTTTAEKFFLRRGYTRIPRDEAPAAIKGTKEFSGICPSSSAFMVKQLMTMIDNPHPKVRII